VIGAALASRNDVIDNQPTTSAALHAAISITPLHQLAELSPFLGVVEFLAVVLRRANVGTPTGRAVDRRVNRHQTICVARALKLATSAPLQQRRA